MKYALQLRNISFAYGHGSNIIENVSMDIHAGDMVAIRGRSGCGKSTLAMIMCGIIPKSITGQYSGDVLLFGESTDGRQIYQTAGTISMVSQDPSAQIFASEVTDEIAFAPENLCYEQESIIECVHTAASAVGMEHMTDYSPSDLSGGQQQLVALASILSLDPSIIILDEVTAQIDTAGRQMIREVIASLLATGKTIITIDHSNEYADMYDVVYELVDGSLSVIRDRGESRC